MSEAVAKGDVLMVVHNLSTDWLSGKRQEQKMPLFSGRLNWHIGMWEQCSRARSGQCFLLCISINIQFKNKYQSPLTVTLEQVHLETMLRPHNNPNWLWSGRWRCSVVSPEPRASQYEHKRQLVGHLLKGSLFSWHKEWLDGTASSIKSMWEEDLVCWAQIMVPRGQVAFKCLLQLKQLYSSINLLHEHSPDQKQCSGGAWLKRSQHLSTVLTQCGYRDLCQCFSQPKPHHFKSQHHFKEQREEKDPH